ncbi:MAG: hypothetical protein DRI90_24245 [Deltaproteobacteria bacterium]|nr:MAG: hypothetical protein DRI90_24245 [Deltaproteobacteria bacterium]
MGSDASVREGQILAGKYRLIELLGTGGMGAVWRAHHLTLDAEVAVKVLHPELARQEQILERFLREAKAAAQLRSPHVVQILDHGLDDGVAFIGMELLEGESLAQRLERTGRLSAELTRLVMIHVGRAVTRAHQAGIVHRDLKPDNVFLVDNDGEIVAKVLDFGIAKRTMDELAEDATAPLETATGTLMGTPYYMGPEQLVSSGEIDHRADLWAMGVMTYECLCGTRPYGGATIGDVVLSVCSRPPPVPSERGAVPRGFDEWFAKATQRDPAARHESARAMTDALSEVLEGGESKVGGEPDPSAGEEGTVAEPLAATVPATEGAHAKGEPAPHGAALSAQQLEAGRDDGPQAATSLDRYLVQKEGEVHTYSKAKLLKQLRKNDLSGLELVRREDEEQWCPLYETEMFRREVPHRGNPQDAARWRLLRDFGAHLAIWVIVCWVVSFSWSGGWDWWKWLWGLFVALHGLRTFPTALALWREDKLFPWKRRKLGGPEPADTSAPSLQQSKGARLPDATPFEQEVERLRELMGKQAGAAAAGLLQRLEQLATAARQLALKEAAIEAEIAPQRSHELDQAEQQARRRAADATTEVQRDLCSQELDAIGERRQAMEGARQALQPLRARRNVATHQLEQLRLDVAASDARALRLPDLSTRIDEIRIEAEAIEEVERELAGHPPKRL